MKDEHSKKISAALNRLEKSRPRMGKRIPVWVKTAIISGGFTLSAIGCTPPIFEDQGELYGVPPVDSGVDGDTDDFTDVPLNNLLYGYITPDGGEDADSDADDNDADLEDATVEYGAPLYGILPPQ
ncbi:MAG: hypothetical protein JXR95_06595 [Deltaproteobacteria bacterium]|nr:hypothetical protein [Deltaproteobacteria bacterium]